MLVLTYVFNYAKGYRALLKQLYGTRQQLAGGNIALFNAISGFQFDMQSSVEGQVSNPIKMIHELCGVNLKHCIHAVRHLRYGHFHVSANIVRPTYESIPKMFYLLRYPQNIAHVMLYEDFKSWRGGNSNNESQVDEYLYDRFGIPAHYKGGILGGVKRGVFKKFVSKRGKFGPAWYRRQVYDAKLRSKRSHFYSLLSVSAHANFIRGYGTVPPRIIAKYPEIITQLSFFNLLLNANAIAQTLMDIGEFDDTKKFILKTYDKLNGFLSGSALYPDQPTYTKWLKIKLPNK